MTPAPASLDRSLGPAYAAAATLAVGLPLALQVLLRPLLPAGQAGEGELVRQIGYTCSAVSFVALALAARLGRRALAGFSALAPRRRPAAAARAMLGGAGLCLACALCGGLYWGLAGRTVERHVRTFLALAPVGFLLFVPRPSRWRRALDGAGS